MITENMSDPLIWLFATAFLGILAWIGRSLARIALEIKTVSMIVRTCPGCRDTVEKFDEAEVHSKF